MAEEERKLNSPELPDARALPAAPVLPVTPLDPDKMYADLEAKILSGGHPMDLKRIRAA